MSFYGYPNARLRARKEKLFNSDFFDKLLKSGKSSDVIAALTETDYRKYIEKGLMKNPGVTGLEEGLKLHLMSTFKEVKHLLKGIKQGEKLMDLILARFDLHNIKTILRGLHSNTGKEEISRDLIPVGQLDEVLLNNLVNQFSLKACIDQLAVFRIPYSKPLLEGYADYNNTHNLANLELSLDIFYYDYIFKNTRGFSPNVKLVRDLVQRDIDMNNIMTLLRSTREIFFRQPPKLEEEPEAKQKKQGIARTVAKKVAAKTSRAAIWIWGKLKSGGKKVGSAVTVIFTRKSTRQKQRIYVATGETETKPRPETNIDRIINKYNPKMQRKKLVEDEKPVETEKPQTYAYKTIEDFFVEGGKELKRQQFLKLAKMSDVQEIIQGLRKSSYYKPLQEGLKNHMVTGSLATLERKIEDFNIKKTIHLFKGDPLSIGIVVAYTWSKFNEVINLRIILRGKEVEMPEKDIKEALVLV